MELNWIAQNQHDISSGFEKIASQVDYIVCYLKKNASKNYVLVFQSGGKQANTESSVLMNSNIRFSLVPPVSI